MVLNRHLNSWMVGAGVRVAVHSREVSGWGCLVEIIGVRVRVQGVGYGAGARV